MIQVGSESIMTGSIMTGGTEISGFTIAVEFIYPIDLSVSLHRTKLGLVNKK